MPASIGLSSVIIPDEIAEGWQETVNLLAEILGVPAALIMKVEAPYIEVFSASDSSGNPYKVGDRENLAGLYCERVFQTKQELLVPDALADPEWDQNPDIKHGMISYLGYPLLWPNQEMFGAICVLDNQKNPYTASQINLLQEFKGLIEAHLGLLYQKHELVSLVDMHKQAEEELRQLKEFHESIVQNVMEGIVVQNKEGYLTFVNAAAEKLLGYTPQEMIGMFWTELIPTDQRAIVEAADMRRTHGEADRYELYALHKDGHRIPVLISGSPLFDEQGGFNGTLAVFTDITASNQAEKDLKESEERFRSLSEATFEGIFIHDEGTILDVNQAAAELFGYQIDELIGQNVLGLAAPESRETVLSYVQAGYEKPYEAVGLRKDGSTFHGELIGKAFPYQGRTVRVVAVRDITESKRVEEALRESEEKYRTILEEIEDSYFETDITGNFTFFNDSLRRILGYTRDELMGMNNQQYMDEENAKKVYKVFNHVYATGQPTKGFDWELVAKDGSKVFVETSVSLISNSEGAPAGFRGIARDVTERVRAEEERARTANLLRTVADVSKQFNAILDPHQLLKAITPLLQTRFALYLCQIFLLDAETQDLVMQSVSGEAEKQLLAAGNRIPLDSIPSLTARAARDRKAVLVEDTNQEKDFLSNPLLPDTRSELAVPLIAGDTILGVLDFQHHQPNRFTPSDADVFSTLAEHMTTALENARLFEERKQVEQALQESNARYRSLFEDSPISLWEEDLSAVKAYLDQLRASGISDFNAHFNEHPEAVTHCASLVKIIDVNQATIDLYHVKNKAELIERFNLVYSEDEFDGFRDELVTLAKGHTLFEREASEETFSGENMHTVLRVSVAPGYEDTWAKIFVSVIDITERKEAERRLEHMATHDPLTDIPNRILFHDRLRHALAHAKRGDNGLAILFIDLDDFKEVNDQFGHEKGDLTLQVVVERLRGCVRESDTIARLGGDEFTFILENISQPQDAARVAQKILAAMAEPFVMEGSEFTITASIGISIYLDNGEDGETLLKQADAAMYRAKEAGKNNYQFHS